MKARSSSSLARTWMDWKRLRDSEKFPPDLGASPPPKFSSSSPSPTRCSGRLSSSWTAVMLPALLLLLRTECPPPSDPSRQSQGIVWFHWKSFISISKLTYRTLPVAHADIALDIEGGSPGEPERLHVRVDHSLVHRRGFWPGAWQQLMYYCFCSDFVSSHLGTWRSVSHPRGTLISNWAC